jgi:hypothetical protein
MPNYKKVTGYNAIKVIMPLKIILPIEKKLKNPQRHSYKRN